MSYLKFAQELMQFVEGLFINFEVQILSPEYERPTVKKER